VDDFIGPSTARVVGARVLLVKACSLWSLSGSGTGGTGSSDRAYQDRRHPRALRRYACHRIHALLRREGWAGECEACLPTVPAAQM